MPFVQSRDVTLFVTESGSPDAPPLLFSNSLGTTHHMWDAVVSELSTEFRCIRYDTRGHGASTCATNPYEIEHLADDAAAILDNLGIDTVHFAGLSLGGMTGQAFAVQYPDRLKSLTLMATSAYMPARDAWEERAALVRRDGTQAIVNGTLERWFTPEFRRAEANKVQLIANQLCAINREGYAAACEAIARMDLRARLSNIVVPTRIIAGQEDPATPLAMAEGLRNSIIGSRLVTLSPAAHLLAIEQAERVVAELRAMISDCETGR